jgi:hypothetical protein
MSRRPYAVDSSCSVTRLLYLQTIGDPGRAPCSSTRVSSPQPRPQPSRRPLGRYRALAVPRSQKPATDMRHRHPQASLEDRDVSVFGQERAHGVAVTGRGGKTIRRQDGVLDGSPLHQGGWRGGERSWTGSTVADSHGPGKKPAYLQICMCTHRTHLAVHAVTKISGRRLYSTP